MYIAIPPGGGWTLSGFPGAAPRTAPDSPVHPTPFPASSLAQPSTHSASLYCSHSSCSSRRKTPRISAQCVPSNSQPPGASTVVQTTASEGRWGAQAHRLRAGRSMRHCSSFSVVEVSAKLQLNEPSDAPSSAYNP